jgi:hypothetical protein
MRAAAKNQPPRILREGTDRSPSASSPEPPRAIGKAGAAPARAAGLRSRPERRFLVVAPRPGRRGEPLAHRTRCASSTSRPGPGKGATRAATSCEMMPLRMQSSSRRPRNPPRLAAPGGRAGSARPSPLPERPGVRPAHPEPQLPQPARAPARRRARPRRPNIQISREAPIPLRRRVGCIWLLCSLSFVDGGASGRRSSASIGHSGPLTATPFRELGLRWLRRRYPPCSVIAVGSIDPSAEHCRHRCSVILHNNR